MTALLTEHEQQFKAAQPLRINASVISEDMNILVLSFGERGSVGVPLSAVLSRTGTSVPDVEAFELEPNTKLVISTVNAPGQLAGIMGSLEATNGGYGDQCDCAEGNACECCNDCDCSSPDNKASFSPASATTFRVPV